MWALARGSEAATAAKRTFRMSQIERVCEPTKECAEQQGNAAETKTRDGQRGSETEESKGRLMDPSLSTLSLHTARRIGLGNSPCT
jgi:hypothetical protein